MTPNLSDLETLARQAGEILRASFESRPGVINRLQVDYKGEIDLVTDVDHRSENFIIGEIKKRFPQDGIVAEESGTKSGESGNLWYVDPLDGTVNYAHGVPIFSVSIAYQRDGELQLGVVYDPMQKECFCAKRGRGAWLNGEPIKVSDMRDLETSLLVTGFPYDIRTSSETNLDHYARLSLISQGVRRLGSAAIDLCYVAAGRFDGYWELNMSSWDVAAGVLIVKEAGGLVTDIRGMPALLSQGASILAANRLIHPLMVEALRGGHSE